MTTAADALTPKQMLARKYALEIVEGALGEKPASPDVALADLGADSVDLIAMEIEVEEITGHEIEAGTFTGKTVADLAAFIEARLEDELNRQVFPINGHGRR